MILKFKKNKSPLKNSRLAIRKRRIFYIKMVASIVAVLVVIIGASVISKLHAFAITDVVVEGNAAVDPDTLKQVAHDQLAGSYMFLFSKSNKFLYDKTTIKEKILTDIKRVETVDVSTDSHTLTIAIKERAPAYTWCTGVPTDITNRTCYFLDNFGYIFSEAPVFSGNVFFAFYGMIDPQHIIGSTFLHEHKFKDIDKLVAYLKSIDAKPYALLAKENGVFEIYFETGGKLLIKQDQKVDLLIANIDVISKHTQIFSSSKEHLDYLDLRFGNKVYFKISGDNEVQEVEESGV